MNKDHENSDSDYDPQVPPEDYSSEDIKPPHKEDTSFEPEQSVEFDSEKPIDEDSATKNKSYGKKGWLFLLFLIITIGAGGYFYSQKIGINFPTKLPSNLNKSFPLNTETLKPLTAQSRTIPIKSAPKIFEAAEEPGTLEKPTSDNEKTIKLLRDEIRSLKIELKQKNSTLPPQNVQNVIPHISGRAIVEKNKGLAKKEGEESEAKMEILLVPPLHVKAVQSGSSKTFREKTKELIEKERTEPEPDMQVSLTHPTPVRTEPMFKQNQKTAPQRSKEVQAYLDFIEDTGNKLFQLIKEWSNRAPS